MEKSSNKYQYHIYLFIFFLLYTIIFSVLSIKKYLAFNCDLDFGNTLQAFYNTLEGRWMEMTWNGRDINSCRWGGHTELIYTLILPFFIIFKSPFTLLILQTVVIGLGGIVLFYASVDRLEDPKTAFILALCYWLFPYLAAVNLSDFHSDAFMIFPYLLAWYALKRKKYRLFWIAIILGSLCKEYACVFNFLLGIILVGKMRKTGIALIVLSAFQFFLLTPLIISICGTGKYILHTEGHALLLPDSQTGKTISQVLKIALMNMASKDYIIKTLSLLFICNITFILFRKGLVLVIPLYLALTFVDQHGILINHRHALLIPPLFITLMEGIRQINPAIRSKYALLFVLLPSLLVTLFYPGSLLGKNIAEIFFHSEFRNVFHYQYTAHDRIADSLITGIPAKVPVASENNIRTKLADREWSFLHPYPTDINRADYYVFDFFETLEYKDNWPKRKRCAKLLMSNDFRIKSYVDGVLIIAKCSTDIIFPFFINKQDSLISASSDAPDISILNKNISSAKDGYIMETTININRPLSQGDALISILTDAANDTIRILHLPVYTQCRLTKLEPGIYNECFYFQIPQGKQLDNREHSIGLYKKDKYLTFFTRKQFLLKML